jgi:glycosyltransferase involved in cell wall biosynthesis
VNPEKRKPRVAVISPFLDKRHGSERIVLEWLSHLPGEFEIHVYSQRVEDMDPSTITWHRIPKLPGPHLLNFIWWLAANRLWRGWDRRFRGLKHDLVYSPGANCLDADVVSVHIVFAQYTRQVRPAMILARNPIWLWPRLLHRKLYYRLAMFMERHAYANLETTLILIAKRTAKAVEKLYGTSDRHRVLYLGLDHHVFNPGRRGALRETARRAIGLSDQRFALVLVGNDWRNKGVPVILEALVQLPGLPFELLLVSREDPAQVRAMATHMGLGGRVRFLSPRQDIEFYYAAADAYAGLSLEDNFALPPAEAMACGLPVIVSAANGTSEIITHGVDGLILDDPKDATGLARMIRRLYEDEEFRTRLGEKAAATARQYTWERNGRELAAIFEEVLRRRSSFAGPTLSQDL